jgi:hypothetical protein
MRSQRVARVAIKSPKTGTNGSACVTTMQREEQHITSHQHDMDPPQEQHTMPLKEVVKQLKRSSCAAAFCSLAPTQRELRVELERLGFAITNHSNTMMVKMWHLHKQEPLNYSHNVSG